MNAREFPKVFTSQKQNGGVGTQRYDADSLKGGRILA